MQSSRRDNLLHLLQCPLPTGSCAPGEEAKTSRPLCTWANRGEASSKGTDEIRITRAGQWLFQHGVKPIPVQSALLSQSPLPCLEDSSSPVSSSSPSGGVPPSSSHHSAEEPSFAVPAPLPREQLTTAATAAPSHPAAFAAIYSAMMPRGGRDGLWHGMYTPWEPSGEPWRSLASRCAPSRAPHRRLNNAWAVIQLRQFALFCLQV